MSEPDDPTLALFDLRVTAPKGRAESLRSVLSVWSWSMIGAVTVGAFGAQLPVSLLSRDDKTRRRPGRLLRDAAVLCCKLNPMWDFRLHGELPDYQPGRTVVVANHVSNSDPFLMSHLPWEMKWLGKESLFKVPVVGWSMRMAGDVPIRRGAASSAKAAMRQCREQLERGMPIMIFPEGTRSRDGELLPFKDGAFRLAIDSQADILPVAVAGTREALRKHSWRFGFSRGLVTVGQPIATTGMTKADMPALKEETRRQIKALYATIAPLAG